MMKIDVEVALRPKDCVACTFHEAKIRVRNAKLVKRAGQTNNRILSADDQTHKEDVNLPKKDKRNTRNVLRIRRFVKDASWS